MTWCVRLGAIKSPVEDVTVQQAGSSIESGPSGGQVRAVCLHSGSDGPVTGGNGELLELISELIAQLLTSGLNVHTSSAIFLNLLRCDEQTVLWWRGGQVVHGFYY